MFHNNRDLVNCEGMFGEMFGGMFPGTDAGINASINAGVIMFS